MNNLTHMHIIAILLLVIAVKLFLDHRKKNYKGVYKPYGNYEKITAVKHDLFKAFTVELFPLLVFGLASGQKFYDSQNPINSWVGRSIVILCGYLVYHELVQPYVINKLPYW